MRIILVVDLPGLIDNFMIDLNVLIDMIVCTTIYIFYFVKIIVFSPTTYFSATLGFFIILYIWRIQIRFKNKWSITLISLTSLHLSLLYFRLETSYFYRLCCIYIISANSEKQILTRRRKNHSFCNLYQIFWAMKSAILFIVSCVFMFLALRYPNGKIFINRNFK